MNEVVYVDPPVQELFFGILFMLLPWLIIVGWIVAIVALVWCVRSIKEIQRQLGDKQKK